MIIVTVSIGPTEDRQLPLRRLEIENLEMVEPDRSQDSICAYEVRSFTAEPSGRLRQSAKFTHRYGDDQYSLVYEAIEALGGKEIGLGRGSDVIR